MSWQAKAHRVIGQLCHESFEQANRLRNGRLRARHVPYAVPRDAEVLVAALKNNDELGAKVCFQRHAFGLVDK